uniref:Uncharacterized protein n=1 Tax=Arundo donax TaxID=35708 RepID=A0A0A9C4F4_ARUDO
MTEGLHGGRLTAGGGEALQMASMRIQPRRGLRLYLIPLSLLPLASPGSFVEPAGRWIQRPKHGGA